MDRLYFGERARRRARLRRLTFWVSLLSMAAMLAGIPGTGGPLELVNRFGAELSEPRSEIQTTEMVTSTRRFQNRLFRSRPAPTNRMAGASDDAIVEAIRAAAARHGVPADYLVEVAECESGLDPEAYNPAGFHGLFQFDETTWGEYGNGSIWDPVAQAEAAASLIAAGQADRWPVCS